MSGKEYTFVDPDVPLAELPTWLIERLAVRTPKTSPAATTQLAKQPVTKGGRTPFLRSLIGTMINRGMTLQAITAAVLAENAETCIPPLPEDKVELMAEDMVQRYPAGPPHASAPTFQITDDGIYWLAPNKGPALLSSPIDPVARTRDGANDNWSIVLRWKDQEGLRHQCGYRSESVTTASSASVVARLSREGLPFITIERGLLDRFLEFLQTAPVKTLVRTVSRIGWHGDSYVLPDETIGPEGSEEILFQAAEDSINYWNERGTEDDWREKIGELCAGNSVLVVAASCGFAGPLLSLVGAESGGIHLHGLTSIGKTTALQVGASVCGVDVGSRDSFKHGARP